MITIIDFEIGNLTSIKNMLKKAGIDSVISADINVIARASKLILPGVGSFGYGIKKLRGMDYFGVLQQKVLVDKIPILGVCLGAQLLLESSEEGAGAEKGLGWIKGKVVKFNEGEFSMSKKIPHMGWNLVDVKKKSKLTEELPSDARFYFVHSYHMICEDECDVLFKTNYGYEFVSGIERDNILGVQFHPEKSHKFGMKLYNNFDKNY